MWKQLLSEVHHCLFAPLGERSASVCSELLAKMPEPFCRAPNQRRCSTRVPRRHAGTHAHTMLGARSGAPNLLFLGGHVNE